MKLVLTCLVRWRTAGAVLCLQVLAGCATMPGWLPADGPSRAQVQESQEAGSLQGVRLIPVTDPLARRLADNKQLDLFSQIFEHTASSQYLIGPGDVIEVSVWEAPPAVLFGATALDPALGPATTRAVTFPTQMVATNGTITMPFVGHVDVRGRTAQQIEGEIVKRLTGQANHPQVLVRVVQNNSSNAIVVGDVQQSTQIPLTPKGERLLDALAAAGGAKQAINRMSIQLSRNGTTATMPLDEVIRDPRQNISLRPGDVLTALFQPLSFSVLGATGQNQEIPFEARGISLAQALARAGGLDDRRADARGVFVFRYEQSALLDGIEPGSQDALLPVIYEVDLRDPASFFVAQHFPIQDRDVLYVANAPAAELEKFLRLVATVAAPAVNVNRITQ